MSTLDSSLPFTSGALEAPVASAAPTNASTLPLAVLGDDLVVPLVTGEHVRYVNLDCAASGPCLKTVHDAVGELLPWYSSVHRGAGFASEVMSSVYDTAREIVAAFVHARADDAVIFTRNTTDALNLLASALPADTSVVSFASEHHANLLPWQQGAYTVLPVPGSREEALAAAEAALGGLRSRHRLLAVTGASNVTGEIWPLAELASIARRHGARIAVDAAQLAPHRAIDVATLGIDYLAMSAHKLYAPFGAGVLVGRRDWLDDAAPYLAGGGAVRRVTMDRADWRSGPARHEAGTPNVVGAAALAAACRTLAAVGMSNVAAHEASLQERAVQAIGRLPGVDVLSMWGASSERVGIVAFRVEGWHPNALAAALSAEHGIGVRDGAFCAHPLVASLVGSPPEEGPIPGAVRASFGASTNASDIERFVRAMEELVTRGPRWHYRSNAGRYVPDPDPRPRPRLGLRGSVEALDGANSAAKIAACDAARRS